MLEESTLRTTLAYSALVRANVHVVHPAHARAEDTRTGMRARQQETNVRSARDGERPDASSVQIQVRQHKVRFDGRAQRHTHFTARSMPATSSRPTYTFANTPSPSKRERSTFSAILFPQSSTHLRRRTRKTRTFLPATKSNSLEC